MEEDHVIEEILLELIERVINEQTESEEDVDQPEQDTERNGERLIQVGGGSLKVNSCITEEAGGRFRGAVSSVTLNVDLPQEFTTEPNGPELFGEAVIRLVRQYEPPSSSQATRKVGIIFEAEEILESIGLSFKNIDQITPHDIVHSLAEMSQSNRSPLDLDSPNILIKITYLTSPSGSGKRQYKMEQLLNEIVFEKKSRGLPNDYQEEEEEEEEEVLDGEIDNTNRVMKNKVSTNCLPHALYQTLMYHQFKHCQTPTNRNKYRASLNKTDNRSRHKSIHEAIDLMKKEAKVTKNNNFDWYDIDQFQKSATFSKLQIIVFMQNSYVPFYKGPDAGKGNELYILLDSNHYRGIRSLVALFRTKYYCKDCETGYRDVASHYKCKNIHRKCGKEDCPQTPQDIKTSCKKCGVLFPSIICYENHLKRGVNGGKSRCEFTMQCPKCLMPIYTNKNNREHICGSNFCNRCNCTREKDHKCQMMPSVKNEENLKRLRIFYDIESKADPVTGLQTPVLFIALKCCPKCSSSIPKDMEIGKLIKCRICSPQGRLKIIECVSKQNRTVDVAKKMTEWLFSKQHENYVAVAHNASGYDAQFILEQVISSTTEVPELCLEGTKLIFMKHKEVKLLDSMKYLTMSLSSMAKTFQIESKKGDFPITFIKPENFDYNGNIPANEYYCLNNKSPSVRKELENFLDNERSLGKTFNFINELFTYCYNDVFILARAMTEFEKSFEAMTEVCLLEETVTAASAAVTVFRRKHLDPFKQIVLDAKPAVAMNASVVSQKFMAWLMKEEDIDVKMSTTAGEQKVDKYRVDGFVDPCQRYPQGLIVDFRGCYWHGHSCKYSEEVLIGEQTAKEIRDKDDERIKKLEQYHPVKIVWECEVSEQLKYNKEMADFFKRYTPRDILHIENALVGGRTEVFKLYVNNDGKKICYLDVVSLYPTVMKHHRWPVGPPEDVLRRHIKTPMNSPNDIDFEGFITCKVLAPQKLQLPLLPGRVRDRLMFFLCLKCAELGNENTCGHSQEDRAFDGTFTTVELRKALSLGYRILEAYHGVKWNKWVENTEEDPNGGLFTSYVNAFMEEKIYSSGFPSDVKTQEDRDEYCRRYEEMEQIVLNDQARFVKNPGKRAVTKLLLNSLWGKFAQNVNRGQTEIVIHPSRFWELLHNTSIVLQDVRCINDVLVIKYQRQVETLSSLRTSAVHLAALTTSYARLRLYALMEAVGGVNIVYTDTDSIVFTVPDGCDNPLAGKIGDYLGYLTDEVDGEMLEFVTIGPKTYAYKYKDRTGNIKIVRKAKGITVNSEVDKELTFDLLKEFVMEVLDGTENRSTAVFNQFTMQRDRQSRVYSKNIKKQFKYTFNKRRVLPNGSTLPYGF